MSTNKKLQPTRFPRLPEPLDYRWPQPLRDEAFQGLAGEIVRLIEPESESDPAALLIQFLTLFGNCIGPHPFFLTERTKHHANLFSLIVGQTAKSRKGTGFDNIKAIFEGAAPKWVKRRFHNGLSSGEGLISAARDERARQQLPRDRRVFILEPEFARVLRVQRRDGNTLSPMLRQAWDGTTMQILNKNTPMKATGAHVSIVGHITQDELKGELRALDQANGYANRLLFVCSRRSKRLPQSRPLDPEKFAPLAERVKEARGFAKDVEEMKRSSNAQEIWNPWYNGLPELPGMFGATTGRAEAQVVRLSMIYALLDKSSIIRPQHLQAALAVWRYCEDSVRSLFGTVVGDRNADQIYEALRGKGEKGMPETAIRREVFSGNIKGDDMARALELLRTNGFVECKREATDGAPRNVWRAVYRC